MVADKLDVPFENLDVPFEDMDTVLSPVGQKWGAVHLRRFQNTRVFCEPIRIICAQMRGQLVTAASQSGSARRGSARGSPEPVLSGVSEPRG